jgi:ketol-acid reductoisomerase
MANMFFDKDADQYLLENKTIGVIGYGNQGHAQAQNMRDNGCRVIVASRPRGESWKAAEKAGFEVYEADEAAQKADIIIMLVQDDLQPQVYRYSIEKALTHGKTLQFAHGFNIYYRQIIPPPHVDVILVAPKLHGVLFRKVFTENSGPPGSIAVFQNASGKAMQIALASAKAVGLTRSGVVETTFKEEVVTDIFNEQCGIGGGVVGLLKAAYEVMIEAGYGEETAYLEVFNEIRGVAELINMYGPLGMINRCSMTARYGITLRQSEISKAVKEPMHRVLHEIEDGTFAQKWLTEGKIGYPNYRTLLALEEEHPAEAVRKRLEKSLFKKTLDKVQ